MSYNVAYKRQYDHCAKYYITYDFAKDQHWFVLKDRNGKVRDWIHAVNINVARSLFKNLRDYGRIPKGYTVEQRGPVTRENW